MESKNMSIMPERSYSVENLCFDEINEGDVVVAFVTNYSYKERRIYCVISDKVMNAFIDERDFNYPKILPNFDENFIPPEIRTHIGRVIVAEVVKKFDDGSVMLNRAAVIQRTIGVLASNIECIVPATIEAIYNYGAFVDIGNGVQSLLCITEFSKCIYEDLYKIFKIGEQIYVKIKNFDEYTEHFCISRKEAYHKAVLWTGTVIQVRVFDKIKDGAYVEYNPATRGIMDWDPIVSKSIMYGEKVMCYVRECCEKGFKAQYVCKCRE